MAAATGIGNTATAKRLLGHAAQALHELLRIARLRRHRKRDQQRRVPPGLDLGITPEAAILCSSCVNADRASDFFAVVGSRLFGREHRLGHAVDRLTPDRAVRPGYAGYLYGYRERPPR